MAKKARFGEEAGGGKSWASAGATKCYNCGKDGHMSRDCSEPKKERVGGGVCFAFQKGECTRGDACRFSHTEGGGGGGGGFGASPRSSAPCYAFQKGECSRGDSCRFSHDPNAQAPQRSSQPCYAFQKGECSRGDSCRFSHD